MARTGILGASARRRTAWIESQLRKLVLDSKSAARPQTVEIMSMNNRASWRCLVQPDRSAMELQVGSSAAIQGHLVNVSAGGFAVTVSSPGEFPAGAMATMATCDGTHLVRIQHVQQEGASLRLGLQRVRDPEPPRNERGTKPRRRWYRAHDVFLQSHVLGFVAWLIILFVAYLTIGRTGASLVDPKWSPRLPSRNEILRWRPRLHFIRDIFKSSGLGRNGTEPAATLVHADARDGLDLHQSRQSIPATGKSAGV